MTGGGVHSLQLEEGRSAVVSISSPRLWKVLVSFDGGLRSHRARAAHHRPRRGTPSKTENGILRRVGVDAHTKTASDASARWLSMFDVTVDVNVDGDVHVHVLVHVHVHVHVDEDVDVDAHVDVAVVANKTEHVCFCL